MTKEGVSGEKGAVMSAETMEARLCAEASKASKNYCPCGKDDAHFSKLSELTKINLDCLGESNIVPMSFRLGVPLGPLKDYFGESLHITSIDGVSTPKTCDRYTFNCNPANTEVFLNRVNNKLYCSKGHCLHPTNLGPFCTICNKRYAILMPMYAETGEMEFRLLGPPDDPSMPKDTKAKVSGLDTDKLLRAVGVDVQDFKPCQKK